MLVPNVINELPDAAMEQWYSKARAKAKRTECWRMQSCNALKNTKHICIFNNHSIDPNVLKAPEKKPTGTAAAILQVR